MIGDWNAKVGNQETPGITGKFGLGVQNGRAKANRVLQRECTGYSKHPLQTTRADSIHGYHQIVITKIRLIIFFAAKDGEALYSQQKQDWELTVAQIMNPSLPISDLKKVGKTTGPLRYDLNQILNNYTVEVRNRFKGLDMIDRVPDGLWTEVHDIVQETGSRPSPWKRNAKRQNGCLRRPYK